MTPWTKQQYLDWLKTRGPIGEWKHQDCKAADRHIEVATLSNLARILGNQNVIDKALKSYIMTMARCHFGSSETDNMLKAIKAYPDYMDKA